MMIALLFLAALWLAYANGANDNMKGVATLLGSGTTGYRGALWWGTGTTFVTHVSVGSLFGLGCVTRGLVRRTFRKILLAWIATLPAAVALAWLAYLLVG